MISLTPRRLVLTFAALLCAALPAAAEPGGDAVLSAGFAAAMPTPAQLAGLKAAAKKPAAPAAPKTPAAAEDAWLKIVDAVKKDGKHEPGEGLNPTTFTLEATDGDPQAAHVVRIVTFGGMLDDEGLFHALGAVIIEQTFTLDAKSGNWIVEQWVFETDVYGQAVNGGHGVIEKSPEGAVVSSKPDRIDPTSAKVHAKYESMIKSWTEGKP